MTTATAAAKPGNLTYWGKKSTILVLFVQLNSAKWRLGAGDIQELPL